MSSTILLADDSPTIHKVLRLALSDSPYDLHIVDNGEDAIKKVREIQPDIVLADVLLPAIDGYKLCEEIKAMVGIPVILLYGAFENIDEKRLVSVGADGSLKKPFATQELFKLIRELTGGHSKHSFQQHESRFEEEVVPAGRDFEELLFREPAPRNEKRPADKKKEDVDLSYLDEKLNLPTRDEISSKKDSTIVEDTFSIPPITTDVKPNFIEESIDQGVIENIVKNVAKEAIEKVAWEVVPQIAERIIKEEIQKLLDKSE